MSNTVYIGNLFLCWEKKSKSVKLNGNEVDV